MTPERRVQGPRRKDDAALEIASWIAPLVKHWSIVLALGGAAGSIVTLVGTAWAAKYTDPSRAVNALKVQVDSNVVPRLVRVESMAQVSVVDRANINKRMDWLLYMSCREFVARHPREFRPEVCTEERPK